MASRVNLKMTGDDFKGIKNLKENLAKLKALQAKVGIWDQARYPETGERVIDTAMLHEYGSNHSRTFNYKGQNITIKNERGRLSDEDIEKAIREAEKFKEEDEKAAKRVEAKNGLEGLVYNAKNSLNDEKLKDKISEADKTELEAKIKETQEWMDSHLDASTEDYEAKTKEFESVSHRVFSAMHNSGAEGAMPNMGGMNMPGGMGGFPGGMNMPEGFDMSKMEEMLASMSPEEKENLMKMAGQQMSGMNMGGMGGMGGFDPSLSGSDHNEAKIEEVD